MMFFKLFSCTEQEARADDFQGPFQLYNSMIYYPYRTYLCKLEQAVQTVILTFCVISGSKKNSLTEPDISQDCIVSPSGMWKRRNSGMTQIVGGDFGTP